MLNQYANNLKKRLSYIRKMKNGVIYDKFSHLHRVIVIKNKMQIILYFAEAKDTLAFPTISGVMSLIDIDKPLELQSLYAKGIILSLIWMPKPKGIFQLGFGGGVLPLFFNNHFPNAVIESVDIEPLVKDVAQKFFGVQFNGHQKLTIKDGREYLEKLPLDKKFDIINIDAFRGIGVMDYTLGTTEFYDLCKKHLTKNGVIVLYTISSDELLTEKLYTFRASFNTTYLFRKQGVHIHFGMDTEGLTSEELKKRVRILRKELHLSKEFENNAKLIKANCGLKILHDNKS